MIPPVEYETVCSIWADMTIFEQDLGDGITSRLGSIWSYYWVIFLVGIRYISTISASFLSENPVKICGGAISSWQCCTVHAKTTMIQQIIDLSFLLLAEPDEDSGAELWLRCFEW